MVFLLEKVLSRKITMKYFFAQIYLFGCKLIFVFVKQIVQY